MSAVTVRKVPLYFHVTQNGHDYYARSWSRFGKDGQANSWWCEEHKDFEFGTQIDPLSMPEDAREAFASLPTHPPEKASERP